MLPPREILLSLAALHHFTDRMGVEPWPHTLELRAILALLYERSNGDRRSYDQFWKKAREVIKDEHGAPYERSTHCRTCLYGIADSLGVNIRLEAIDEVVRDLVDQQRALEDPAHARRRKYRIGMSDTKYIREIIATKGRPRSLHAKRLMAERVAAGLPIDREW